MSHLGQELINECARLVYEKWEKAFLNLKAIRSEVDDGSEDWSLFHAERLHRAIGYEAKARRFLREITPLHTNDT